MQHILIFLMLALLFECVVLDADLQDRQFFPTWKIDTKYFPPLSIISLPCKSSFYKSVCLLSCGSTFESYTNSLVGRGMTWRKVCKDRKQMHHRYSWYVYKRNYRTKDICSQTGCLNSKDASLLIEKEKIFQRWGEYVVVHCLN